MHEDEFRQFLDDDPPRLSVEDFLCFRDDFVYRTLKRNTEYQKVEKDRRFIATLLLGSYTGFMISLILLLTIGTISCWILLFTFLVAIHLIYADLPAKFNDIQFVRETEFDFYDRILREGFKTKREGENFLSNLAYLISKSEIPKIEQLKDAPSVSDLREMFDLEN